MARGSSLKCSSLINKAIISNNLGSTRVNSMEVAIGTRVNSTTTSMLQASTITHHKACHFLVNSKI